MTFREQREQQELATLSPFATQSAATRGRKLPVEKCDYRTEFQKDRDRITHSKAFRRLMHKTQVFISPEGDHYRTRLTHTLEVAQIARTIARALGLNEDLTEAIALGHDLGHTPFGHTGEDALNTLLPGGFRHNEQSVRVVEVLENEGEGLNLTGEVVDGILNHRLSCTPSTPEGRVVQVSDKIAYMNHDVDDALRAKLLAPGDLPAYVGELLGPTPSKRIDFLVKNFVENSVGKADVGLSPDIVKVMMNLKAFLLDNVYANQLHQKERNKISKMLRLLYEYYLAHPDVMPVEFVGRMDENPTQTVADYIAGMTDRFAMTQFNDIFMPTAWEV
jgi:dGTPase